MDKSLVALLLKASPSELKQLGDIAVGVESLKRTYSAKLDTILESDDPIHGLKQFRDHIVAYKGGKVPRSLSIKRRSEKLSPKGYDGRQQKLERLIVAYHDSNSDAPKFGLTAKDFLSYPGVSESYSGNPKSAVVSLGLDLRAIIQKTGTRISHGSNKTTYVVSPEVSYESVKEAADKVYRKQKIVTWIHVGQELGLDGHGRSIGKHLSKWADERGMGYETRSMGTGYGSISIYYNKNNKRGKFPAEEFKKVREATASK
ncbi:hypothetical protein HYS31_04050 [Candidatus Woesearchaeota archaeon]|nr:hypothetical protein [Candidatus Woesearchaeota archaeon]